MKSLHLLYHELRPAQSRYSYVTPCEEFGAHCGLFARLQQQSPAGHLRPEITFDDGHSSDEAYALPVLERYGLKATFFITAGWTGARPGFMDWSGLRALHAAGHRIGAHGMTHKLLTTCSPAELEVELLGAKNRLEDGIGAPVEVMSLPGGRANAAVFRGCTQAGFRQVFTSIPQAEDMASGPARVGRLNLHAGTSVAWLERILQPESGALAKLQRADRVKGFAKRLLGDRLYRSLWALANHQEPEDAGAPAA